MNGKSQLTVYRTNLDICPQIQHEINFMACSWSMLSDINRNATGTVNIFMNDIVVVSIAAAVVLASSS